MTRSTRQQRENVAKGPTLRVKTVWQTPNEFAVCFASGSLNLLSSSVLVTIGNVRRYGSSKQYGVLQVGEKLLVRWQANSLLVSVMYST
jgi:hypothetical protein